MHHAQALNSDSENIVVLKMVPPTASAKPASICAENLAIGPDGGSEQATGRLPEPSARCLDMAHKPPTRRRCKPNPAPISHKSAFESLSRRAELLKFL